MNAQHSIGMPARCEISTIGVMSAITVRAAQLARDRQLGVGDLARQPLDVLARRCGRPRQADVGGVDAEPSMRCRMSSFSSIVGDRTDGDCSPSRSVSSSSIAIGAYSLPARRRRSVVG